MGRTPFLDWVERHRMRALILIFVLGFVSKVYRLGVPAQLYFDETYHAFTAKRYLASDSNAYNPWATPPKGVAYEWTHPPLAKLLMSVSMKFVGEDSFGWRLGSVVTGTIAIGLASQIAYEFFGSALISILTALLLSIEGLAFSQARIAMNDSYFIMFALFALLHYARWKKDPAHRRSLFWAGTGLGLAASCKWTALYVFGIVGIDWISRTVAHRAWPKIKEFGLILANLGLWPALIYLGSYGHFFWMGNRWKDLVALQKQMWWYHTRLKESHAYQSRPWQWIFNLRPVWFTVDRSVPGKVANIYNLGNSIILWSGFACVLVLLARRRTWTWEKSFLLLSYFMMWLPWVISPRIMFFYHYMPAVYFLCILLAYGLSVLLKGEFIEQRGLGWTILAGSLVWFAVFYPLNTDIPVSIDFANSVYFALPGWK